VWVAGGILSNCRGEIALRKRGSAVIARIAWIRWHSSDQVRLPVNFRFANDTGSWSFSGF